ERSAEQSLQKGFPRSPSALFVQPWHPQAVESAGTDSLFPRVRPPTAVEELAPVCGYRVQLPGCSSASEKPQSSIPAHPSQLQLPAILGIASSSLRRWWENGCDPLARTQSWEQEAATK